MIKISTDDNGIYIDRSFRESTKNVQDFYKNNPFPNYQGKEDRMSLIDHFSKNTYLQDLISKIGFGKKIIEVGSGTSQLSNLIALMTNNNVIAFDATYNALKLGKDFADKNYIHNIRFVQGYIVNINKLFNLNDFDFVFCSGVLHHTSEPFENFMKITEILKENGQIIIGLYNKYGRLYSKLLKILYKIFGKKILYFFDDVLKKQKISKEQSESWIRDQYIHPLESTHSIDEVFKWFKLANIKTTSTIPDLTVVSKNIEKKINLIPRIFVQFFMNFNHLGKDGGLFIVEGIKIRK